MWPLNPYIIQNVIAYSTPLWDSIFGPLWGFFARYLVAMRSAFSQRPLRELFRRRTAAVDRFSPKKLDELPPLHPREGFDSFLASFQLLCGLLCPWTRKLHPQRPLR